MEGIRLIQGDCLEVMDQLINESVKVDAIITDPPYGTTACKWDSVIPFEPMWLRLKALRKDNTPIVLFGSEPFSSALRMSNIKNYKYDWVWDKKKAGNIFLAKHQPMKIHENVLIFYHHNYYPIKTIRKKIKQSKNYGTGASMGGDKQREEKVYTYTHKNPVSIITISNASQKGKRSPNPKTSSTYGVSYKNLHQKNETVLDFTMGSGTTGVACIKTNRNFIGIELDKKYYKIAQERIGNQTLSIDFNN